jgi:hypothetical protein
VFGLRLCVTLVLETSARSRSSVTGSAEGTANRDALTGQTGSIERPRLWRDRQGDKWVRSHGQRLGVR